MNIKLGPKNELQTLGFRTYYNQCVLVTFLPGRLFKTGRLLFLANFPPRTPIQDRTCIRNARVCTPY